MSGRAAAGPTFTVLCRLDEIADGGARGFVFGAGTDQRRVFVLRRGDRVYGYENACPHMGTPLDMIPDRFLDRAGRLILCATHGAQFRIADGYCVAGPCRGRSLTPAAVEVRNGMVRLRLPP